jgi:predicted aldo/keto reductase-like oxidoreductase
MKRRDFLKASVIAGASIAGTPLAARSAENKKPKVKKYKEIGKTGLKMSDISYGTGRLPSSSMILRAIDAGINYFDTAPDYGSSEKYIGEAMKNIQRDKIIIASKFCSPYAYPSHLPLGSKKKDFIEAAEASLSRMKTDYMDFCFVHAIGEQNKSREKEEKRLLDEEMLSAFDTLKQAGKVRFLAVSSHGPDNMEALLLTAVRSGHFDLIMPAFNFMSFPKIPDVLKEAKERKIGVIAMKTLAGAKDADFDSKGELFAPAVFKWVLKHPEVDGLVISIKSISDMDLYLSASGEKFTAADQKTLDRYAKQYGTEYCRTGCSECEGSCPEGVSIATTLRFQMYFKDYGMEKKAIESYARLDAKASKCASCETGECSGGCPYGLPVSSMLRQAHDDLSFIV